MISKNLKNKEKNIKSQGKDKKLLKKCISLLKDIGKKKYTYNFGSLESQLFNYLKIFLIVQELIWQTKPNIIIETGVARGGSLILSASILNIYNKHARVIGIDIDIRDHNKKIIDDHLLSKFIKLIEGSSISSEVIKKVKEFTKNEKKIMIILDSNHTHEHVLKELEIYTKLIKKGFYCVVMDTAINDMPGNYFKNRPWGKNNNPKTAIFEFLKSNDRFVIDDQIDSKLLLTASKGFLKCVK